MLEILRYTEQEWGREQRYKYSHMLEEAFVALGANPDFGRNCNEIKYGLRKFHIGKHYIFYRQIAEKHIEVVRVLHERMNFDIHFDEPKNEH